MLTDNSKEAIRAAYKKLKQGLANYRPRRSQNQMIAHVANVLAEGGNALIEAPTGTGKSMAYLIAATEVARAEKKRLVISTATIALQEQLIRYDIPRYLELTQQDLKVALAKGRNRYLCPRDMAHAVSGLDSQQMDLGIDNDLALWNKAPNDKDKSSLLALADSFAHQTWNGDLDDAPAPVSANMRPLITTTAGGCTGRKCAYFMQCPFYTARRQVDDADIIVANHDLVLADLTMPNGDDGWGGIILPDPASCFYIFDEGHHLPRKAIERGTTHVPIHATVKHLEKLKRQAVAAYSFVDKDRLGRWDLDTAHQHLQDMAEQLRELEQAIHATWVPDPNESNPVWRASLGQLPETWQPHARTLAKQGAHVYKWLIAVRRTIAEMTEGGPTREALAREIGIAVERMEDQWSTWSMWAKEDNPEYPPHARWVSLSDNAQPVCHASEVSAASLLRRVLWDNAAGVILTSATLSTGGNFRYLADALGLPDDGKTQSLPSPFNLDQQARLEIPAIKVLPNAWEEHAQAITDWLDKQLDWDSGNLVLFTSRAKMERVLQQLPVNRVRKVRAQGATSKAVLIEEHTQCIQQGRGSTIFGLASFGEGLDLPGNLCQTVVVTQLPFAVPTDPVGATYAEWLETRNRKPFFEVSLPDATRLLIQYCGRLIRNEQDTGRVVLLDRRIIERRYGQFMLHALPPFQRHIE